MIPRRSIHRAIAARFHAQRGYGGGSDTFQMDTKSNVNRRVPVTAQDFAERAYQAALLPTWNPLKSWMDASSSVEGTAPALGIFNDISPTKLREGDAHSWAKAGFSYVINDGEHSQLEGRMGREQNALMIRMGITPIQRLPREASSDHGDSLTVGARATMRPYGFSLEDAEQYYQALNFPPAGHPELNSRLDRGAFPMKRGDGSYTFSPESLRGVENGETQGWFMFETPELLLDVGLRDDILDCMAEQGRNKAIAFVGPFDATMRSGCGDTIQDAMFSLFRAAADKGVHSSAVVGGVGLTESELEDKFVKCIEHGCRNITVHYLTSDMTYHGAKAMSRPFFAAVERTGFDLGLTADGQ